MKKLIYINACIRPESRTKRIADSIIASLENMYEIASIDLNNYQFTAVDKKVIDDRNNGIVPEEHVALARHIANAERIVIAAPFWDMSFPAALKVFLENMSLFGITFDTNDKECYGLCKAQKVMYITTRGMNISTGDPLEQATPYIRAISHLWGLGELTVISAQNLDYSTPDEIEIKINKAIEEGLEICKCF